METRVITLQYNDELGCFPEEQVQTAIEGRRVAHISSHFFVYENTPRMSIVLLLGDPAKAGVDPVSESQAKDRADPTVVLDETEKEMFEALRSWRLQAAQKLQVPSYVIAHNKQLVRIAKAKPRTMGELREDANLSEKFCNTYGDQVLEVVAAAHVGGVAGERDSGHWWNIGRRG